MAADGVIELRERPEPSLCRGRTTSQLPLNPQCVTIQFHRPAGPLLRQQIWLEVELERRD